MKAAILKGFGSGSSFKIEDVSVPKISSNEVLVKSKATSINPVDWQTRNAISVLPNFLRSKPVILGHDIAGVVSEVGSGVLNLKPGDRVFGTNGLSIDAITERNGKTGTYSEYSAVNSSKLALMPKHLSFAEAATIPVVALTAYQGLMRAGIKIGDRVLVIGGSGGVGSMAVQIAKAKGAIVTAVCSARNQDLVRSLGADELIDYTRENYLQCGKRFDVVFNTIGHQSSSPNLNILNKSGIYVDCAAPTLPGSIGLARRYISGGQHKNIFFLYRSSRNDLADIVKMTEEGKLSPVIAQEIDLSEINYGHELSKTGRVAGKISVTIQ